MENPKPKTSEITRLIKAFGYSWEGLCAAFRTESAFRVELICAAIMLPVSFFLHVSSGERALLIFSLFLVLIVELLNSAIETTVERISSERHPLSKRAKDIASAAVLVSLVNAAAVWAVVVFG